MRKLVFILLIASPLFTNGQVGSEIYLFDVKVSKKGMSVSNPINVTNHPGYDNQPSFHSEEPLLYYSSFNDDGRSDIKTFNFESNETKSFTTTSEREYSPTLTPDGKFISCIIQRDNDAQDLGKYPVEGGEAIPLINNLIVGYHAWVDKENIILFILGDPMTFRWYNLKTGTDEILATNIGRSLHKIPGQPAMSFLQKEDEKAWMINRLDIATKEITPIIKTLDGREDLAWTKDGKIVMSDGTGLFFYDTKSKSGWEPASINLGGVELKNVTRLAISSDGSKLALVSEE